MIVNFQVSRKKIKLTIQAGFPNWSMGYRKVTMLNPTAMKMHPNWNLINCRPKRKFSTQQKKIAITASVLSKGRIQLISKNHFKERKVVLQCIVTVVKSTHAYP